MVNRPRTFRARTVSRPPIEVDIAEVGVRGDGVALWEGKRLFVPFALAGERVKAEIVGETGDGTQARLIEVLRPAAERVAPACRHFGECGGCSLQHLAPVALATWKRERVVAALGQRGVEAAVAETVAIAPGSRRRAVFAYRVAGGDTVIGFNARASGRIVDQRQCPLLDPRLAGLVDPLRALVAEIAAPGAAGDVAVTLTEGGADLCVDLAEAPSAAVFERLGAFGRTHGLARLSWRRKGRIELAAGVRGPLPFRGRRRRGAAAGGLSCRPSPEGEAAIAIASRPASGIVSRSPTFSARHRHLRPPAGGQGRRASSFDRRPRPRHRLGRTRRVACAVRDLFQNPLAGPELSASPPWCSIRRAPARGLRRKPWRPTGRRWSWRCPAIRPPSRATPVSC